MGDFYTARVLAQLELAERHIHDLELAVRADWERASAPVGSGETRSEIDFRQAEQFQLGQIDGLVAAQLVLSTRRSEYQASHLRIRLRPSTSAGVPVEGSDL